PDAASGRFFVLENLEELKISARDKYFCEVTDGAILDLGDAFLDARRRQQLTKQWESWMVGGNNQRDVYGAINTVFREWWRKVFSAKPGIGFNVVCTAHVAYYQKEGEPEPTEYTRGRVDLIDGYFDCMVTTLKISETIHDGDDVQIKDTYKFAAFGGELGKNRFGGSFIADNPAEDAAEKLFEELFKER
ncbi:MAG: hypothetical protein ACTSPB_21975, partial [Candidatus Thorarchaeota archaeon]